MVRVGVLFAVRNVGRHEDVVAGGGDNADFLHAVVKYELRVSAADEDRRFRLAMMMITRHRLRQDMCLTHPDPLGTHGITSERGNSSHTFGLGGVRADL